MDICFISSISLELALAKSFPQNQIHGWQASFQLCNPFTTQIKSWWASRLSLAFAFRSTDLKAMDFDILLYRSQKQQFLGATKHLHKRFCPSVRRSVRPSARRSVGRQRNKGCVALRSTLCRVSGLVLFCNFRGATQVLFPCNMFLFTWESISSA